MSAVGQKLVQSGEMAAICACALLSRISQDDPQHAILIERALLVERRLPAERGLMTGARFTQMAFALHAYIEACNAVVRFSSGERDWRPVYGAQAGLRRAVDRCLQVLGDRCFGIWSGSGASMAPRPGGALAAGAET